MNLILSVSSCRNGCVQLFVELNEHIEHFELYVYSQFFRPIKKCHILSTDKHEIIRFCMSLIRISMPSVYLEYIFLYLFHILYYLAILFKSINLAISLTNSYYFSFHLTTQNGIMCPKKLKTKQKSTFLFHRILISESATVSM